MAISIAIDGPAGVGKSTVAKALARLLGFTYVDTGAMYRAATLFALEQGIPIDLEHQQQLLAATWAADFTFTFQQEEVQIFHGGRDLTAAIRSQAVTEQVSYLAALPALRQGLTALQRDMAASTSVVMEGRDIGAFVLPAADYKFFLTASAPVRAGRRWAELRAKGVETDLATVLAELEKRDRLDSTREISPLLKAADAIEIDTSNLTVEAVIAEIRGKIDSLCQQGKNEI